MRQAAGAGAGLAIAVLAAAGLLRAPITSVPPALVTIQRELHLSEFAAGATTSLPLVCFGVFAFATPVLVARWGLERTMLAMLTPLFAGLLLRSSGSTPAFFVGAVLVGSGIAIGNVLVPALIRARFASQVALLMGLYTGMLQLSGALGSAVTAPLEIDLGWGWALALGIWAVPAAVVLAAWVVLVRRPGAGGAGAPPTGMANVARRRLSWAITAYMGLQSLVFYSLVTWLPTELMATGLSASAAGVVLGAFSLLGLPTAFVAPRFATGRHGALFVAAVYGLQGLGIVLLGFGPVLAVVGSCLAGVCQGAAFSTALTFIADQPDHRDVPALSALAQGVGYIVAALGPMLIGGIHAATGGWWVPNLTILAVMAVLVGIGGVVGTRLHRLHRATDRR